MHVHVYMYVHVHVQGFSHTQEKLYNTCTCKAWHRDIHVIISIGMVLGMPSAYSIYIYIHVGWLPHMFTCTCKHAFAGKSPDNFLRAAHTKRGALHMIIIVHVLVLCSYMHINSYTP